MSAAEQFSVGNTAVGALIGALVAWCVSSIFYRRSANALDQTATELKVQARQLEQTTIALIQAMEGAGLIQVNRDENGRFRGFDFIRASGSSISSGTATITYTDSPPATPSEEEAPPKDPLPRRRWWQWWRGRGTLTPP